MGAAYIVVHILRVLALLKKDMITGRQLLHSLHYIHLTVLPVSYQKRPILATLTNGPIFNLIILLLLVNLVDLKSRVVTLE